MKNSPTIRRSPIGTPDDTAANLRVWTFDPPAIVQWFHDTLVQPVLNEDDTFSERVTKALMMTNSLTTPVLIAFGILFTVISFTPTGEGGRQGQDFFLFPSLFTLVGCAVMLGICISVTVYKRVELWHRAYLTIFPLVTMAAMSLTFVTFPSYAVAHFCATINVFMVGPEFPKSSAMFFVLYGLAASFSWFQISSNHDSPANASSNVTTHPITLHRGTATKPYMGTVAERFIFISYAATILLMIIMTCFMFAAQMSTVAGQQLGNTRAGQSMASALRVFDLGRLERAVDQYKALPFRDDGLFGHLKSMTEDISVYGRFCPRDVIGALRQDGDHPEEAGLEERASVCVMVCELCNVCHIMEQMSEAEAESLLCGITVRVQEIVKEHGGTLIRSAGCQFRVVWGAPQRLHAKHSGVLACCCALQLMHMLREEFVGMAAREHQISLRFRIGIHRGRAIVGNVGTSSELQLDDHLFEGTSRGAARVQSAPFHPRCEYVCHGEAVRVAVIAAAVGSHKGASSVVVTRDTLLDESGSHDTGAAQDLVNFAVRELYVFGHDVVPDRCYTALQVVGICSRSDLVQDTTSRRKHDGSGYSSTKPAQLLSLQKRLALQARDLNRRGSSCSSGSDSDLSDSDSSVDFDSKSSNSSNASSSSSSSPTSPHRKPLISPSRTTMLPGSWPSNDDDDDDSPNVALMSRSGSVPSADAERTSSFSNSNSNSRNTNNIGMVGDYLGSVSSGSAPAALSAASSGLYEPAVHSPRLEAETNHLIAEQNELHRGMIERSVSTVLRRHFFVDDAACETLHTMSVAQRIFSRGTRESIREALRLCDQAVLKRIAAAAGPRPKSSTMPISPESNAKTRRVLSNVLLDASVPRLFVRRCKEILRNKASRPIFDAVFFNTDLKVEA